MLFRSDATIYEQDTSYYNGDGSEAGIVKGLSNGEFIAYTVIVCTIPVAVAIVGVVMFIKRKYL